MIDLQQTSFTSLYNSEKIVKVFDGSFRYDTDTTARTFDSYTTEVYVIPHGFTRPVFTELWWSLDDVNYFVGAGNTDSTNAAYGISFSDSTNIYILMVQNAAPISSGTTIYYKIVCSWITDYDNSDPLIDAFTDYPSTYRFNFQSRYQTVMIAKEGVLTLSTASVGFDDVVETEAHGLDYVPFVKAYYNAYPGEVWPLNSGGVRNPYLVGVSSQVEAVVFTSSSEVIAHAVMKAGNGDVKVWYMLFTPVDTLLEQSFSGADFAI